MESKQKYTQDNYYYEVDDWFVDRLKSLPRKHGIEIASMIDFNFDILPDKIGWTQHVGGVCTKYKEPIYFEVEYLKEPMQPPIFLDIGLIEVDDYLDYILDKNVLIINSNDKTNSRTPSQADAP